MKTRQLVRILASLALAAGCGHKSGPTPKNQPPPPPPPQATAPEVVAGLVGAGPIAVYGANVYSPGQEVYKALRQEDSLMAFLTCQGEPDRLEVLENPGAAPRILLEYTRPGLKRGTVEIAPSAAGYYAAQPIDPNGNLKARPRATPKRSEPAAKPKAATTRPKPTPSPEPAPEEPAETPAPEKPALPQPTATQRDECPIEPWRAECKKLCVPGAAWEWCSYKE